MDLCCLGRMFQATLWKKKNLKSSGIFRRRNSNLKLMRRKNKELLCHYETRTATWRTLIMKLSQVPEIFLVTVISGSCGAEGHLIVQYTICHWHNFQTPCTICICQCLNFHPVHSICDTIMHLLLNWVWMGCKAIYLFIIQVKDLCWKTSSMYTHPQPTLTCTKGWGWDLP